MCAGIYWKPKHECAENSGQGLSMPPNNICTGQICGHTLIAGSPAMVSGHSCRPSLRLGLGGPVHVNLQVMHTINIEITQGIYRNLSQRPCSSSNKYISHNSGTHKTKSKATKEHLFDPGFSTLTRPRYHDNRNVRSVSI
jgi:hypothetical protein